MDGLSYLNSEMTDVCMNSEFLDAVPLWCFLPLVTGFGLLALECGYRAGKWRHLHAAGEKDAPVAAMTASILGLLAFILAFTFSLAFSRFDNRREAVVEEANAIGTTWLRARLLPEPCRSDVAELLRQYTQLRTQRFASDTIGKLIAQSEQLQEKLWTQGTAAAERNPSVMTGLFLQSLNETIDLHSKRTFAGLYSRIPLMIWLVLYTLTLLGLGSVGYQSGLSATRRSPEMAILTLAFAGVLYVIVDLDRGHEGLLQVSQQPIITLYHSMSTGSP